MSDADAERWNAKYANRDDVGDADPWLTDHADRLIAGVKTGGEPRHALDLACGLGANALYLAELGYATTALDISETALSLVAETARQRGLAITTRACDLDTWRSNNQYDVISVFRYLDRRLFPRIIAALAPGGLLFYQTFNALHLNTHPQFNADFVLQPGELAASFSSLTIIECKEPPASSLPSSYLLASKPANAV